MNIYIYIYGWNDTYIYINIYAWILMEGVDAGDDGHGAEPGAERRGGGGAGGQERREVRLRLLPPLSRHVWKCGTYLSTYVRSTSSLHSFSL